MRRGLPLSVRAVLAIVLMVLYFALAIGAVIALVWLGIQAVLALPRIRGNGVIVLGLAAAACFAAAGVIAWSMVPRIDRFEPPGPEIVERDQPVLFATLRQLCERTGEAMPRHVYVMWNVNAFVAQRGGIMGFGSKRVMGLGLPLVHALTISELRAVLAHELGHFYGGDTRLGPWIYKTRGAVTRTVINLATAGTRFSQHSRVMHIVFIAVLAPFRWFGKGFMRVTQAISRAQELSADRLAARLEGAAAVTGGLKKTHGADMAHQAYLRQELLPLIEGGVLPPPGEGFVKFLGTRDIAKAVDELVSSELAEGTGDPYDSHPSLRERVAALEGVASEVGEPDARSAAELFTSLGDLERSVFAGRLERPVKSITWSEAVDIWQQQWRDGCEEAREELRGLTIATIPTALPTLYELARKVVGLIVDRKFDDTMVQRWAAAFFGRALCVVVLDEGFAVDAPVGEAVRCTRGDVTVEPFVEASDYIGGKISKAAWLERWQARGLADRSLEPRAAAA